MDNREWNRQPSATAGVPANAANDSLTAFGPTAFRLDGTPDQVPELAPLALRAAARAALA